MDEGAVLDGADFVEVGVEVEGVVVGHAAVEGVVGVGVAVGCGEAIEGVVGVVGGAVAGVVGNGQLIERDTVMYLETLLEHIDEIVRYRNDRRAAIDIRRVGCWYCKNAPGIGELRGALARTKCPKEARAMVGERLDQETASAARYPSAN